MTKMPTNMLVNFKMLVKNGELRFILFYFILFFLFSLFLFFLYFFSLA